MRTTRGKRMESETALITGASSGIGRATAEALADAGMDVSLAARRKERLFELANRIEEKYDQRALVVPTDVSDESAVETMVKATVKEFGGLSTVVCNAGIGLGGDVENMDTSDYRSMMNVNCDGIFYTARESLPFLRESSGNLVLLGSFSGQYPRPANPIYAATKWWTRGLAYSLQAQCGHDDIAVTVVNPTEVRTEFGSQFGSENTQTAVEEHEAGTVSEPEDVAKAIQFAVSQRSPNVVSELNLFRRDKTTHF